MPEVIEPQIARGMRDVLPAEMARIRRIEASFAAVARAWGYGEIRTPVIEPLHLFTAAGTLSPQTLDGVYSFLDWDGWSGERVVLRPDSTIAAARLYAEQLDGAHVAKLFYCQPVLRFTDDGSSREEWQCGVELIGDTGRAGEIELVSLALDALGEVSVGDAEVRLSHAGIVRAVLAAARLTPDEQSAAYDRLLDGDRTVVDEVEARLPQLDAPLRLLFDIEGEGSAYIANVRGALSGALPELNPALDELAFVVEALEARGLSPRIVTVLARRFEYYSGIVVSFWCGDTRVGAGGRYDELIGLIGRRPVPAAGFALFIDPLSQFMPREPVALSEPVLVVAAETSPRGFALAHDAAAKLRKEGLAAETLPQHGSHSLARLTVRSEPPRFVVERDGARTACEDIASVIAAIGKPR